MSDSEKTINLGVVGQEGAAAAELLAKVTDAMKKSADENERYQATLQAMAEKETAATQSASEMAGKIEATGEKVAAAGEKAAVSALKHRALHSILGELNKVSPGLGEAMGLLSDAYSLAGKSAAGGAVGTAEFGAALDTVLTSLGPLVIAMLGIQAAFQYWDMYKDKVRAAAEAQAEATKKIVDETHKALQAVQALDEAMHPKEKDTTQQDENTLRKQQAALENQVERQKELNSAEKEKEFEGAKSKDQKDAITQKYDLIDKQLDDWKDKQKAALEQGMVGTMDQQLAQVKAAEDKAIANRDKLSRHIVQMQSQKDSVDAALNADMSQMDAGELAVYLRDKKKNENESAMLGRAIAGDQKKVEGFSNTIDGLRKNMGPLGDSRAELADQAEADTSNAAYHAETNRQVFAVKGTQYGAQGLAVADAESTPWGSTVVQIAEATGKNHEQIQNIFTGLLNHTLNFRTVMAQMQSQLEQLNASQSNSLSTQSSG